MRGSRAVANASGGFPSCETFSIGPHGSAHHSAGPLKQLLCVPPRTLSRDALLSLMVCMSYWLPDLELL